MAAGADFKTGIVDLRRYHNIYISSGNLSTGQTLGPQGQSGIIKQICVTQPYGYTISDNAVLAHDWMDVSKKLLKTLQFRISDAYGKTIDLRGMPVSFSLLYIHQAD